MKRIYLLLAVLSVIFVALIGVIWVLLGVQVNQPVQIADVPTVTPTDWPTPIPPPTLVVPNTPGTCVLSEYWQEHYPVPAGELLWDDGECWYLHSNAEFDMDLNSNGCGLCHDAFRHLY